MTAALFSGVRRFHVRRAFRMTAAMHIPGAQQLDELPITHQPSLITGVRA